MPDQPVRRSDTARDIVIDAAPHQEQIGRRQLCHGNDRAGGVIDVVARTWADKVKALAGNVFIDNGGDGGGTIGASNVARAEADGYSLLFGETSCLVIAPSLMLNPPYDAAKDFAPVSLAATSSTSIVVHPSVPPKNLAEFIAYAKKIDHIPLQHLNRALRDVATVL